MLDLMVGVLKEVREAESLGNVADWLEKSEEIFDLANMLWQKWKNSTDKMQLRREGFLMDSETLQELCEKFLMDQDTRLQERCEKFLEIKMRLLREKISMVIRARQ